MNIKSDDKLTFELEVAMLHRVDKVSQGSFYPYIQTIVPPESLEYYLAQRQDWHRYRFEDLSPVKGNEKNRKNGFILTFDDGYRDILTNALPILEKYDVPCLLFITTAFINGEWGPYEFELARMVSSSDEIRVPGGDTIKIQTIEDKKKLYQKFRLLLKPKSAQFQQEYLKEIASANNCPPFEGPGVEFLNWQEIKTLDRHPLVTFGAHTHNHSLLTALPFWQAYREIKKSKNQLETALGHPVESFSYPYGNTSLLIQKLVQFAGFRYAFTTQSKRITIGDKINLYAIPRIDIKELTSGMTS